MVGFYLLALHALTVQVIGATFAATCNLTHTGEVFNCDEHLPWQVSMRAP